MKVRLGKLGVPSSRAVLGAAAFVLLCLAGMAPAQSLRFSSNYKDAGPPSDSRFRIGPLYSSLTFYQSVGYRYSDGGKDIINAVDGNALGEITGDGSELPLISTLNMRNYWLISRNADMDASLAVQYEQYPLDTQEDKFTFNLANDQIQADFSYAIGYQARIAPHLRARLYDEPKYLIQYIDYAGRQDRYGGQKYARFENTAGLDLDYLMQKDLNLAVTGKRIDVVPSGSELKSQRSVGYFSSAALEYQADPRLVVGSGLDWSRADYPEADSDSYDQYGASVFANFELSKNTRGSASMGYSTAKSSATSDVDSASEAGTVVGALRLENEFAKRWSHTLQCSRSQSRGFEGGVETSDKASYVIGWKSESSSVSLRTMYDAANLDGGTVSDFTDIGAGIDANWLVLHDVLLSASSLYSERDNNAAVEGGSTAVPGEGVDYATWAHQLSSTWQMRKDFSIKAYGSLSTREGDSSSVDYDRWVAGITGTYTYEF